MKINLLNKLTIFFFLVVNIQSEDFFSIEYERILKNYTKISIYKDIPYNGVDYKNLEVKNLIKKVVFKTQKFNLKDLKTESEELAFWINAYNIHVISLVIDNYPITSIMDLGQNIFDKKYINIGENIYSLNDIEHNIIRKKFREPRIHFALVCAAISCPDLRNEMYTGKKLDLQLEDQTKIFLNSKKGIFLQDNVVYVSNLFNWYKDDFGKTHNDIIKFINKYNKINLNSKIQIQFLSYYWDLNIIR